MAQVPANAPAYRPYQGPVLPGTSERVYRATGYTPPKPQVLGASTGPRPAAGPAPQNNGSQQAQSIVQSNQDAGNSQIEADFNQAMEMLNSSESGLRSQAGAATGQIESGAATARNEITNTQTVGEQGVNTSLQQAEKQGASAIQQARDLFRQTQQSNNSQLSAMGLSSSSVSEALAERLGVETARRIGGITGSLDEVRKNATMELGRIKTYYTGKLADVTNWVNDQKAVIQNSLIQGINQINSARSQAASAKAQARSNLLSQVQSQLGQLAQQQQQFQQSLDAWAAQKSAALTPIAQDPNYVQNLLAQTQQIQKGFNPSQFVATPSFNVDSKGQYTGQINLQKPPQEDEELINPFAAQV